MLIDKPSRLKLQTIACAQTMAQPQHSTLFYFIFLNASIIMPTPSHVQSFKRVLFKLNCICFSAYYPLSSSSCGVPRFSNSSGLSIVQNYFLFNRQSISQTGFPK